MLVHAELIFKHVGLGLALENALLSVAPGGGFSVVLQLPSEEERDVASTSYTSLQTLKQDFHVIDIDEFQRLLAQKGFQIVDAGKPILTCRKGTLAWYILPRERCVRVLYRTRPHLSASRRISAVGGVASGGGW